MRLILTLAFLLGVAAGGHSASAAGPHGAEDAPPLERRSISGLLRNVEGARLGNATVCLGTIPYRPEATRCTRSDLAGRYGFFGLQRGLYFVHAWAKVEYRGRTYSFYLYPVADGDSDRPLDPAEGIVRNFVLRPAGPLPAPLGDPPRGPGSYYGGSILLPDSISGLMPAPSPPSRLKVTLTPQGPLADGRHARLLTYYVPIGADLALGRSALVNVPLADYRLRASIIREDGYVVRLRVVVRGGATPGAWGPSGTVAFAPHPDEYPVGSPSKAARLLLAR